MTKKIWIDITNSPHVLFFRPIIKELLLKGYTVIVTARDFAQTYDLLEKYNIKYYKFGHYAGKNLLKKIFNLFFRSYKLYFFAKKNKFNLSLSHNSIDICIVSKILNIPIIDIFDYEHAIFHHINFRCSTKIMCPKYIPSKSLYKFGGRNKIIKYPGLKEQIYFSDYSFDDNILSKLKIDSKKIIVVVRPPAETSVYHYNVKNNLYYDLINYLGHNSKVFVVFLGRTKDQIDFVKNKNFNNFLIPLKAIDGPSLIKKSDLVISAGGTINREAVALGTPVYSIFKLKLGGVDKYLIKNKKMFLLNKIDELKIKKKKTSKKLNLINPKTIVDVLLKYMR